MPSDDTRWRPRPIPLSPKRRPLPVGGSSERRLLGGRFAFGGEEGALRRKSFKRGVMDGKDAIRNRWPELGSEYNLHPPATKIPRDCGLDDNESYDDGIVNRFATANSPRPS